MIRDFATLLNKLESKYPVFATDIRRDEIEENKSFFIYNDDGDVFKSDSGTNQYQIEFYLSFVTREKAKINKIEIIELFNQHRLFFRNTDTQFGKLEDLDVETSMTTFTFYHIEKMCRG